MLYKQKMRLILNALLNGIIERAKGSNPVNVNGRSPNRAAARPTIVSRLAQIHSGKSLRI